MIPKDTKILIVDDMASLRGIILGILTELGFQNCEEADNGISALKKIEAGKKTVPFQFIISDITMPEMNGIELLQKIRSNPSTEKIPFLMLTSQGEMATVLKAVELGVSGYMLKPVKKHLVEERLNEIWAKKLQ